jgi:hypothetical protein
MITPAVAITSLVLFQVVRRHARSDRAYGADVTTEFRVWLTAALVVFALVAVVGFFIVVGMFTGEYWCEDRSPWWGPPEDPNSTCSGHSWARDHPGEFPDTMPK